MVYVYVCTCIDASYMYTEAIKHRNASIWTVLLLCRCLYITRLSVAGITLAPEVQPVGQSAHSLQLDTW